MKKTIDNTGGYVRLHGIQLKEVKVVELSIIAKKRPDPTIGLPSQDIAMLVGHTEYDRTDKSIFVSVKIEVNEKTKESETLPYFIVVSIVGEFIVNDEDFQIDHIDDWANRNAPIILQPYLRQHVYSLTLTCGFKPLLLPLVQVPTLISKSKN